jgi:manganese/iron transport system ATP-binding protein
MFIARALAQEAELMLMDEPLSGLDLPSQEGILSLLDELRRQNVTVMVATHDLEQAAQHFDRIMLLNHRLIGFGLPGQVLQTDNLIQAYGGRLRSVNGENVLAVDDCCDEGEDHVH